MPIREPFDPKRPLVAAREFRFAGVPYAKGDPFPKPDGPPSDYFSHRNLSRQYETGAVNHVPLDAAEAASEEAIQMTGPSGGRYKITAPWLAEPMIVRGKVLAEQAFEKIKAEGAPLGWIEGGTETAIEEVGGGWFAVSAPWLAEPEKVQGRDAAEARQAELHAAGAPGNDDDAKDDESGQQGAETGTDGEGAPAGEQEGADANSANAGTAETDATGAAEQGGTDDAEQAEGAESGADGKTEGEAGKDNDPPAAP